LVCYGLYEYLRFTKKQFKGIFEDYKKIKRIEKEWKNVGQTPEVEKLRKKLEMVEEGARKQYQQKWDIINGLPSKEEIKAMLINGVGNACQDFSELAKEIYDRQQNKMFKKEDKDV